MSADLERDRAEVAARYAAPMRDGVPSQSSALPGAVNFLDPQLDPQAAARLLAAKRESERLLRSAKYGQLRSTRTSTVRKSVAIAFAAMEGLLTSDQLWTFVPRPSASTPSWTRPCRWRRSQSQRAC